MKLHTRIGLGLVAGALLGVLMGDSAAWFEPLGTLFIKLVRMIIVPLVASSLVVAIAGLPGREVFGRMGLRAFAFIVVSLILALLIGIGFGLMLRPGAGFDRAGAGGPEVSAPPEPPPLIDTLLDIVPSNMIAAAADGSMLQVLFVSLIFGLATGVLADEQRKPIVAFFGAVAKVMFKLVGWIMLLAPFGVFGLVAAEVGRSGVSVLVSLGYYLLVVLAALAAHVALVYAPVVLFLTRQSLRRFFQVIRAPLMITFGTCSTSAALPESMRVMQDDMGLSPRVASFVVPLGTVVGRDGSAIYQAISVLFIAQAFDVVLSGGDLLTLIVTASLSALAVASVPAASFVNLTIILSALGLPLEGAALVLGVERPLDMVRSSVNLVGQLTGATYVASAEGEISEPGETAVEEPRPVATPALAAPAAAAAVEEDA